MSIDTIIVIAMTGVASSIETTPLATEVPTSRIQSRSITLLGCPELEHNGACFE